MSRVAFASALWFPMVWFGWEVLVSVTDLPRQVGPVLGLLASMAVASALSRSASRSSGPALDPVFRRVQ